MFPSKHHKVFETEEI